MTIMRRPCPTCGAATDDTAANAFRPFCSERCQQLDLARWLDGAYAVPGEPLPPDAHRPVPSSGRDER